MSIQQQVQAVRARMAAAAESSGRRPEDIALCAATKVQSDDTIRAAIAAGITLCGENRVQELTAHLAAGAYEGARVHFIGHLQTNLVGVYTLVGGRAEFKPVEILTEESDFYVVSPATEGRAVLRAGDEVIVRATGLYDGKLLNF